MSEITPRQAEPAGQTPHPVGDDHEGWVALSKNLHTYHPALQTVIIEHLARRNIEVSPEHHQEHVDLARPSIPNIDNLPPAEQDLAGEVIEIGQQAIRDKETVAGSEAVHTTQESAAIPLQDALKQARVQPSLWHDKVFLKNISTQVASRAEAASQQKQLSKKELRELESLGIIAQADKATARIFDCDTVPGPLVTGLVRQLGIAQDHFLTRSWGSEVTPHLMLERIGKHLRTLEVLHDQDPTAPNEIFERFGIIHFGRYSPEQLLDQLNLIREIEAGGKKPNSVIVVATATGDYNGSLEDATLEGEHNNAILARKKDPRVPPVIFIEADLPESLGKTLETIGRDVAPISALFVTAHSDEKEVHLSSRGAGSINSEAYGLLEHFDSQKSMTPGAEICLQSCSAGAEHGIAEKLSVRLGKRVYATSKSSYGVTEPFAFEQDENGDWHYLFGFSHDEKSKDLAAGHVFGEQGHNDSNEPPSSRELTWRATKAFFAPRRAPKPSYISRRRQQRHAARTGARRFNVHD